MLTEKNKVHAWLQKFYLWKIYFSRADAYLGIPMALAGRWVVLSLFLHQRGYQNDTYTLILLAAIVAGMSLFGWWDVKNRNAHLEVHLNNRQNPELMQIHERTSGRKCKTSHNRH